MDETPLTNKLHVVVKHLHTSMRVLLQGNEAEDEFADQLLAIRDNKYPIDTIALILFSCLKI